MATDRSEVLIPLKSFATAKGRLASVLTPEERSKLARAMAARVVEAAAPLSAWVVCDDDDVAAWARSVGASVVWTPGLGLNGALQAAVEERRAAGTSRVVIAHGDLPFAVDLTRFADAAADEIRIVADRHGTGTNLLSLPTGTAFVFQYGTGSFAAHRAEAQHCGLSVRVDDVAALAWDVDEPDDLDSPPMFGTIPGRA